MLPIIRQAVEHLRGDEHNPVHSLDGWLLTAIAKRPPSSTQELAASAELRMGPRGAGPEIGPEHVVLWVRDAAARRLIEAVAEGDRGPRRWRLTAAGRERGERLGGPKVRLGGALGWALRMPSRWASAVERLREQEGIDVAKPPPPRAGLPKIRPSPGDGAVGPERARENLEQVKHIIVLMMENRSFDHMLGYLSLIDGQDEVRGLRPGLRNSHGGTAYEPEYLASTAFPRSMDPPHGKDEIARQINGGAMDGFVESFARANDVIEPQRVMGYYTHRELPVYDHLAHNFLLCDQWFCSVPSATWPNRLFAVAGTCDPEREGIGGSGELFYDLRSFVQLLEREDSPDTWRWYSWDPGSLRVVDERYRLNAKAGFHHDHFRRVAQHAIEPRRDGKPGVALGTGLLEDAARGDLPSVAWIDPNFVDLSILDANSNDDHPPSDVRAGQELVMLVLRALVESPCWKETMLVIAYDEHGGFHDHEPPPRPPEDAPPFPTYGVRVPAFVVSPFVEPGTVSHTVFDHTSITRTILERFGVDGAVEEMARTAPRVARAEHLGRLLTRRPAATEPAPDLTLPNAALEAWRHGRADRRSAAARTLDVTDARRTAEEVISGFPEEFLDAARTLRDEGLPAGHP